MDKLSYGAARALDEAYNPKPKKVKDAPTRSGGGFGFIFAMLFVGVIIYGLFTYLPPQLDDRYTGSGQVIGMVNPNGNDPQRDLQYSEVNQGNAKANLTNSLAEQRRSSVWIIFILALTILGMISMIARSIAPPKL